MQPATSKLAASKSRARASRAVCCGVITWPHLTSPSYARADIPGGRAEEPAVRCGGAEVGSALAPLLSGRPEFTAVFAFNDEYALLALQQLTRRGVAVPGDVAVIGCDDSPMAAISSPPLSSVRFGSTGTHILADAVRRVINGERLPRQITLGRPFVVRRESA